MAPDGTRIEAEVVVSDFDARTTFTRLVPPYELEPEVGRAIRSGRYRGSVARVSLGLRALPVFDGVDVAALRGTLVVGSDVVSLERAWDQAKRGALPDRPYIEVAIPSIADPGLAPEGKHVLSAWVQCLATARGADAGAAGARGDRSDWPPSRRGSGDWWSTCGCPCRRIWRGGLDSRRGTFSAGR